MVPHIVFDPAADGYWPGPDVWECARFSEDASMLPATSGICDPPGTPGHLRERLVSVLTGPRFAGHPGLRLALPPSTSPCSPAFDPQCYGRAVALDWLLGAR